MADVGLVSHDALAVESRERSQPFERVRELGRVRIAAPVQSDVDLEAEAKVEARLGRESAVRREPFVRVDEPHDAGCIAPGKCLSNAADGHRLADKHLRFGKRLQHGVAHRQMERHERGRTEGAGDPG